MPSKPANLPPKTRAAFLKKVRGHASALVALLEGTRFDVSELGEKLEPEQLREAVLRDLEFYGEDDAAHVVAYWVDASGVLKMPFDYPDCHFVRHLEDLIQWAEEDDYFDRAAMISSAPIRHARSDSARVIQFSCTLYERLKRNGAVVPFSVLATIANVALDLPAGQVLDEDAVRKQVRRHEVRGRARADNPRARDDQKKGTRAARTKKR